MRNRTGCSECRERHVKCSRKPGAAKCDRCVEHDRECMQTSLHRFRPVKTVPVKRGRDGRATSKQNLTYDNFQVWVDLPSKVDFGSSSDDAIVSDNVSLGERQRIGFSGRRSSLRTGAVRDDSLIEYPQALHSTPYRISTQISTHSKRAQSAEPIGQSFDVSSGLAPISSILNVQTSPEGVIDQRVTNFHLSAISPPSNKTSPSQSTPRQGNVSHPLQASPVASMISHSSMRPGIFSASPNHHSPGLSISPSWPFQTAREAKLFYHYVKNISPWIDVCDSYSYFGREIPRRAGHHPIISSAIFALASRHLSLLTETEVDDSPHYVDECLQILINILEDPLGHADENLLAAVILLRSHEELSDNDERCHALGTTRLLNSITAGAGDGGLRESASWICLRQHIYLSLTGQEPLSLNLSNYHHSSVFNDQSDESWANRIIFIFAHLLNYVFEAGNTSQSQLDPGRWSELESQVNNWFTTRPWYFSALWSEPDNQNQSNPWPELLTSHPSHVVGLQYYCLSKIILAIYDPKLSRLGFSSHRLRKNSEAIVVDHLRTAIGLATSNPDVTNAMFQGSHILAVCGSYLQSEKDQQAAVQFLEGMKKSMGWNTTHIIQDLREQWQS